MPVAAQSSRPTIRRSQRNVQKPVSYRTITKTPSPKLSPPLLLPSRDNNTENSMKEVRVMETQASEEERRVEGEKKGEGDDDDGGDDDDDDEVRPKRRRIPLLEVVVHDTKEDKEEKVEKEAPASSPSQSPEGEQKKNSNMEQQSSVLIFEPPETETSLFSSPTPPLPTPPPPPPPQPPRPPPNTALLQPLLSPALSPLLATLVAEAHRYYMSIRSSENAMAVYLDHNPRAWQTYVATPFFGDKRRSMEAEIISGGNAIQGEDSAKEGLDVKAAAGEACRCLWEAIRSGRYSDVQEFMAGLKGDGKKRKKRKKRKS